MAADDGELLAVEGPVEIADEFGLKVGDCFSWRTGEVLEPEIIDITVAHGVDNAFAVAGQADWRVTQARKGLHTRPFEFHESRRLAGIERYHGQLFFGVADAKSDEGGELSVGRDGHAAENLKC